MSAEDTRKTLTIPWPLVRPLGIEITVGGVMDVWNTYVKPFQDEPPSMEMRCLTAILRAVYDGMENPIIVHEEERKPFERRAAEERAMLEGQ